MKDATIYIYDASGLFVKRMDVSIGDLLDHNYRVRIEGLPQGDYQFVVWSGMTNSMYAISGDNSTIANFRLSLANTSTSSTAMLPDLYYGYLSTVHYDADEPARHDVFLKKNTNELACVIMPTSSSVKLSPADFSLSIVSANAVMDAHNNLASDNLMTYEPFASDTAVVNDNDYGKLTGACFSVSTLRMLADKDCRIILKKQDTGRQIFNVSLPEYIGMIGSLYTNLGRPLSVQEYLDRQDFYTVVFFLSDDLQTLLKLQVNSWRLRANHHLKL